MFIKKWKHFFNNYKGSISYKFGFIGAFVMLNAFGVMFYINNNSKTASANIQKQQNQTIPPYHTNTNTTVNSGALDQNTLSNNSNTNHSEDSTFNNGSNNTQTAPQQDVTKPIHHNSSSDQKVVVTYNNSKMINSTTSTPSYASADKEGKEDLTNITYDISSFETYLNEVKNGIAKFSGSKTGENVGDGWININGKIRLLVSKEQDINLVSAGEASLMLSEDGTIVKNFQTEKDKTYNIQFDFKNSIRSKEGVNPSLLIEVYSASNEPIAVESFVYDIENEITFVTKNYSFQALDTMSAIVIKGNNNILIDNIQIKGENLKTVQN